MGTGYSSYTGRRLRNAPFEPCNNHDCGRLPPVDGACSTDKDETYRAYIKIYRICTDIWDIPINNHGNEGIKPLNTMLMEKNIDVFDITYEELVQFVQEGYINMNEFVLLQDKLVGEYGVWKQKHGYEGTSEQAMQFLNEYEERLYTDF